MMTYKFCLQAQIDSPFPCEAGEGQEGGVKIREATKYTLTPTLPRFAGEGKIAGF